MGYKNFRIQYLDDSSEFKNALSRKQDPKALVISCSDSRLDPAILFGSKPGELFVVRNIANLVPPFEGDSKHHGTSAALEFGVLGLKVEHIIILGHSFCGGIRALMEASERESSSNFIETWMDIAELAKKKVLKEHSNCSFDQQTHLCEKGSLICSLKNLDTFPWIKEGVDKKELSLHAWYFDLNSGILSAYQKDQDKFIPLDTENS